MYDRDDIPKHRRIAQHALVRRQKSKVYDTPVHSSPVHIKASTSEARASPSSSSHKRRVSPTDTSLPPSSRRQKVSPIQVPEVHESSKVLEAPMTPQAPKGPRANEPVPPQADEDAELGPSQAVEVDKPVPSLTFGGVSVELSLFPLYRDHTSRHIWDGEDRDPLKFINHGVKCYWLASA
ncbi:unnamed protein product [Lathyrus oleraceus]